ncbi:MAG: hypothetical protein LBG46_03100 [Elusimicrobiota bacterium]|jgi:hypothetical protein|nr:hypothetical protein [Elusimicrobiota bacterium]
MTDKKLIYDGKKLRECSTNLANCNYFQFLRYFGIIPKFFPLFKEVLEGFRQGLLSLFFLFCMVLFPITDFFAWVVLKRKAAKAIKNLNKMEVKKNTPIIESKRSADNESANGG